MDPVETKRILKSMRSRKAAERIREGIEVLLQVIRGSKGQKVSNLKGGHCRVSQ